MGHWDLTPEAVREAAARSEVAGVLERVMDRTVDPLYRLLDPGWVESPWRYEWSQTEPWIPGVLHQKQRLALEAGRKHKHRWLFWGNQAGKSTVGAVDMVLMALGRHPYAQHWEPPLTLWASALTWDLWEQVLLPELLTWIPPGRLVDAPEPKQRSNKRTVLVRADNGSVSRIVGKSAEQGKGKYQSARVHAVWLDEEHPEAIWDEILPRLLRFGGVTLSTMTPLLGLTWVYHRIYEPARRGVGGGDHWVSHAGVRDNPGVSEEDIKALEREFQGNPAALAARLDGKFMRMEGLALRFDGQRHLQSWKTADLRGVIAEQGWKLHAGIDFGSWRFAFVFGALDRAGRLVVIDEIFSQRETLEERARRIDGLLMQYVPPGEQVTMRGDAANPTDIAELNATFQRLRMPWRVSAVTQENKARATAVERMNNLLSRGALVFRREIGEGTSWRLGQSAAREGRPVMGSRLLYEVNAWAYPKPKDGEVQSQDPADSTADGADLIAALRYMVMTVLRPARVDKVTESDRVRRKGGSKENYDFDFLKVVESHPSSVRRRSRRGF